MKHLKNFLNHERYKVIFTSVALLGGVLLYSCDLRLQSPMDPSQKLTQQEMEAALTAWIAGQESQLDMMVIQTEGQFRKFEQFEQLKEIVFNSSAAFIQNGGINPVALLFQIGTVFGLGAVVDDVRTRKKLKNGTPTISPVVTPVATDTPKLE